MPNVFRQPAMASPNNQTPQQPQSQPQPSGAANGGNQYFSTLQNNSMQAPSPELNTYLQKMGVLGSMK